MFENTLVPQEIDGLIPQFPWSIIILPILHPHAMVGLIPVDDICHEHSYHRQ